MRWTLLLLAAAVVGCGTTVTKNPDPVEVSGKVMIAGKPVTDVILTFQPTGAGLPAPVPVTDGAFKATILPGTYAYFIAEGKDKTAYEAVPPEHREASLDRQVEVTSSTSSLDIAF